MSDDASPSCIDDDLHVLSWSEIARRLTERRQLCAAANRKLTAVYKELDRANAEIVRLRTDLIDLQQLMRSK